MNDPYVIVVNRNVEAAEIVRYTCPPGVNPGSHAKAIAQKIARQLPEAELVQVFALGPLLCEANRELRITEHEWVDGIGDAYVGDQFKIGGTD